MMSSTLVRTTLVATALAVFLTTPAQAQYIYLQTHTGLWRANDDGSNPQRLLMAGTTSDGDPVTRVDTQRGRLLWNEITPDVSRLVSARLDGTDVRTEVQSGSFDDFDLDRNGGRIYWADAEARAIFRTCVGEPQAKPEVVVMTTGEPNAIAVDDNHGRVFWYELGSGPAGVNALYRADLDGQNVQEVLPATLVPQSALLVDRNEGQIYWSGVYTSGLGFVARTDPDGANMEIVVLMNSPAYLAGADFTNGALYTIQNNRELWRTPLGSLLSAYLTSFFSPGRSILGFSPPIPSARRCADAGPCGIEAPCAEEHMVPPHGFSFKANGENGVGFSVSSAGDVNGDGFEDVLIGTGSSYALELPVYCQDAPPQQIPGSGSGEAYVVFGSPDLDESLQLTPAHLDGTRGFKLVGPAPSQLHGLVVGRAGDINGDGIDDVVVGDAEAESTEDPFVHVGVTYVIFGDEQLGASGSVDMTTLDGSNGFAIRGLHSARSVASAGDMDGDGLVDLIIGPPARQVCMVSPPPAKCHVLLGGAGSWPAVVDLEGLGGSTGTNGTNGFEFLALPDSTASYNAHAGLPAAGIGDLNGDSLDDVLIGDHLMYAAPGDHGGAYVLFGRTDWPAAVTAGSLDGSNGFVIRGDGAHRAGFSVSGGDVNADGQVDLLIGAPGSQNWRGELYALLGAQDLGESGIVWLADEAAIVSGQPTPEYEVPHRLGASLASGFDLNGDGISDVAVAGDGVTTAVPFSGHATALSGDVFVMFGDHIGTTEDLWASDINTELGFVFGRFDPDERTENGRSISALRDVNGDGLDDLIIGAPGHFGGRAHIIFGSTPPPALVLLDSSPPNGAIDARQPFDPGDGTPRGWDAVELVFDGPVSELLKSDLEVFESGGDGIAPHIVSVTPSGKDRVIVQLDSPIEPGTSTSILHRCSGFATTLVALPGDVDGTGIAAGLDVLRLIDGLNGLTDLELWQCDIDDSGECGPRDILRLIDVLNGAGSFDPWSGATTPGCP